MAITIRSSCIVDATPDIAWRYLMDIETAAPCFPGAQLKEKLTDGSYKGAFTVKLGPLSFNFAGKFRIEQQDDDARTAVVIANGMDTKGRGGADANIKLAVSAAGNNKSRVDVVSEANLSGTVAQYGRGAGMIEALSQQLLNQFSKNLSVRIGARAVIAAALAATVDADEAADSLPADAKLDDPPRQQEPAQQPQAQVIPLDAGALARKALWHSIRQFFARLVGIGGRR